VARDEDLVERDIDELEERGDFVEIEAREPK
jgi:hypothetical protein